MMLITCPIPVTTMQNETTFPGYFMFCNVFVFLCSGTVDDTELVEGLVLEQKISHLAGGISQVEKAKIGLIQFCISPPKTDVSVYRIGHFQDAVSLCFKTRSSAKSL